MHGKSEAQILIEQRINIPGSAYSLRYIALQVNIRVNNESESLRVTPVIVAHQLGTATRAATLMRLTRHYSVMAKDTGDISATTTVMNAHDGNATAYDELTVVRVPEDFHGKLDQAESTYSDDSDRKLFSTDDTEIHQLVSLLRTLSEVVKPTIPGIDSIISFQSCFLASLEIRGHIVK